jgi:gliding motility-associated transport system permease protein
MSGALTIYRRELAGLFLSPLAWILLCISLLLTGWFFVTVLNDSGGDVTVALSFASGGSKVYWLVMLFLPPLLTMRMISEESRNGLLEFLMTSPVSDASVVLGKFLAAWSFLALLWSSTLIYAVALHGLGVPPDWPPVLGGYVGALLVSALFTSIGLLSSSLFSAPALSAFMALCASIAVIFLPPLTGLFDYQWLSETVEAVDILAHFQRSFLIGVLDTQVLLFFTAWAGFFLFLTVRSVEAKRWK